MVVNLMLTFFSVFIATSFMSGVSISVLIGEILVNLISSLIGGSLGKIAVRAFRSVWGTLFSQSKGADSDAVPPNELNIGAQNNPDNAAVNNKVLEELVAFAPQHSCFPPSLGYAFSKCFGHMCDKVASVGYIHGEVMHVCLCTDCARIVQLFLPRVCVQSIACPSRVDSNSPTTGNKCHCARIQAVCKLARVSIAITAGHELPSRQEIRCGCFARNINPTKMLLVCVTTPGNSKSRFYTDQ